MDTQPEVPEGKWFKRFPELVVCGEGELIQNVPVTQPSSDRRRNSLANDSEKFPRIVCEGSRKRAAARQTGLEASLAPPEATGSTPEAGTSKFKLALPGLKLDCEAAMLGALSSVEEYLVYTE
jgi:hypothetical protein